MNINVIGIILVGCFGWFVFELIGYFNNTTIPKAKTVALLAAVVLLLVTNTIYISSYDKVRGELYGAELLSKDRYNKCVMYNNQLQLLYKATMLDELPEGNDISLLKDVKQFWNKNHCDPSHRFLVAVEKAAGDPMVTEFIKSCTPYYSK